MTISLKKSKTYGLSTAQNILKENGIPLTTREIDMEMRKPTSIYQQIIAASAFALSQQNIMRNIRSTFSKIKKLFRRIREKQHSGYEMENIAPDEQKAIQDELNTIETKLEAEYQALQKEMKKLEDLLNQLKETEKLQLEGWDALQNKHANEFEHLLDQHAEKHDLKLPSKEFLTPQLKAAFKRPPSREEMIKDFAEDGYTVAKDISDEKLTAMHAVYKAHKIEAELQEDYDKLQQKEKDLNFIRKLDAMFDKEKGFADHFAQKKSEDSQFNQILKEKMTELKDQISEQAKIVKEKASQFENYYHRTNHIHNTYYQEKATTAQKYKTAAEQAEAMTRKQQTTPEEIEAKENKPSPK